MRFHSNWVHPHFTLMLSIPSYCTAILTYTSHPALLPQPTGPALSSFTLLTVLYSHPSPMTVSVLSTLTPPARPNLESRTSDPTPPYACLAKQMAALPKRRKWPAGSDERKHTLEARHCEEGGGQRAWMRGVGGGHVWE